MRLCFFILAALVATTLLGKPAHTHALEPAYLEISVLEGDKWQITWRRPQVGGRPMQIDAELPEACFPRRGPAPRYDGRAFVVGWVATCETPISQGELSIDGLQNTATDVLVRYAPSHDASPQMIRLTPEDTRVKLPAVPSAWSVLFSYFGLGVDHILGGIDHLLFVLALMLFIADRRQLIIAITSFTIAHSITLTSASLGLVSLPIPPVEAVIALSIVFLATEILTSKQEPQSFLQKWPWLAAFSFGLLHGFGFASALKGIGLPENDLPLALLSFNLGVEAGQLMFVCAVLIISILTKKVLPSGAIDKLMGKGRLGMQIAAYSIGSIAMFWTIQRIAGFVGGSAV